jgi:hypothetical protein
MHAMTTASAAGRNTDPSEERSERLAVSLEEQFHMCRKEGGIWLERNRSKDGGLYDEALEGLLKVARTSAQIAQVITQIDRSKIRKTNTQ